MSTTMYFSDWILAASPTLREDVAAARAAGQEVRVYTRAELDADPELRGAVRRFQALVLADLECED